MRGALWVGLIYHFNDPPCWIEGRTDGKARYWELGCLD